MLGIIYIVYLLFFCTRLYGFIFILLFYYWIGYLIWIYCFHLNKEKFWWFWAVHFFLIFFPKDLLYWSYTLFISYRTWFLTWFLIFNRNFLFFYNSQLIIQIRIWWINLFLFFFTIVKNNHLIVNSIVLHVINSLSIYSYVRLHKYNN